MKILVLSKLLKNDCKDLDLSSVQFSSVAQSCPTLCDSMDCSMPGPPSITNSQSLLKLMPIKTVMPSSHLILCRPLLLQPSIFPSIKVFSSESILHIRPKYWSCSFSISPSNEHSGLISFRIDWKIISNYLFQCCVCVIFFCNSDYKSHLHVYMTLCFGDLP